MMVLFFIMSLVAAYTSRNLIFEQRTSANQLRSTQASGCRGWPAVGSGAAEFWSHQRQLHAQCQCGRYELSPALFVH
ncbi:MAG: hypothetical protein IPH51_18705 [Rubrivivax sp.]|nr:hypothetical protein [Rubrivivax sp.]